MTMLFWIKGNNTHKDSKFLIPLVRLWVVLVDWQLVFVEEVSVLDMLSKPEK